MSNIDTHRRVKKALNEIEKNNPYLCINVETIAKAAKTDTRTARKHLTILEEDGLGKFCDPKKKTYTSNKENGG